MAETGSISISFQRAKEMGKSKVTTGARASDVEFSWGCQISQHATPFFGTNEVAADLEGFFSDARKWFFVQKDEHQLKKQTQFVPVNEMIKIVVSVEEFVKGETKKYEVTKGFAMLTPDLDRKVATCYIASDTVAVRLWSKQAGHWLVQGVRVAIGDAARGKMIGHKLLTKEEIKLKKVAMEGVETAGSQSTAQGTGKGSRNNTTKTGASNQSGMLEEADEKNEKIIGRHVYPRSGLRVKLVKELNVNPENPAWKEEIHLEKWREAEGRPGIILEVVEEDMNYGILKNEFCRVMWDSTGLRVTYKTGYEGEYDLALYEVDDTNDDEEFELQKGRKLPLDMVMKRKKLKLEESKRNRFTQLYGNGNQRASMDNVRYFRGAKHLLGKDVDLTGSSKKDKMKPIDWLKMCFAVPMVKNQYPPVPTPLLQDPYADPYTHAGSPRASMFTPTKMGIRTVTVAIVGAGVAAAVLARRLELLNYKITCFEKRNCQGGRLGNVRKGEEVMSLGCPYFQASSPAFIKEVQDWVDNGLVVPFDMNVGVLHGQCLGEVSHFDTLTPDPELYEKVKQMPNIMAANRSVVDSAGDVVGVRFGRFTTCRIWYDCASELWALEQQHEDIAKELAACEAAKDRAISGIRMIEYLLENMQTLKFITEPGTGSMSNADGTGSMSNADKFYSKLALLQAQKSCKQTEKIFEFLKDEIKQRLKDDVELKKYLDPNERKIAQTRMLVRRKENRIQMEQKMGQSLPETCLKQTHRSSPRSTHQHEEPESTSSKVVVETCVPKRRNAIDEGNQPGIRRKAKGFVEEEVAEEGCTMTWDEVLESFIPDVEFCQTWTLHSELISSMKEKWVLALRELHAAHIAIVKSEELLEIALLKLESAAKAIEQVKVYAAHPGPDQLVDVVVDLRYNKDFHPGDQIILYLPHFKLFDSHYKKLSVDTAGESKDTFKKATFFPKTQLLVLQHDSGSIFNAGTPIRIRVPRLVVIPKRGVSLEHSFEFTVRAEAVSGSSVLHALATALVDVPKKPTHVQLRKRDKVQDTEMELIHTDTLHDDEDGPEDLVHGDEKTQWATCMYDSEFSLMEALAPDDGLPRHRTAHVHAFESGLGPNQKLYMPTPKSAKMMEVLAPGVKYVYNHSVMAILESDGKHRIIAQKDESEKEEEYGTQSGANVWRRGNTAGSDRPETANTDFSNSYGGSSRQTTGILKRQASPPRMSTAIAKKRLRNMGDFDLVLICTPPAVAARLTAQIAPQISAACLNARLQPCWVAYAKFEPVLSVSNDAFAVIKDPDNVLLWATRETSRFAKASSRDPSTFDEWRGMKMLLKGGRPSTAVAESQDKEDAWVLHASAEFSRNHLKTPPEEVAQVLMEHFVKMLDIDAIVDIIDTFAVLWEEGMYSDFGPYVSEELPEARTSEINFIATEKNGGWGRIGIDGALFDPARGIGVAGDWLVEGCVEGAFLSGQALANRVMDAHASCVPADFTLAPSKFMAAESGIDHSDKWGYGEWPLLDVEEGKETFRWNGRPVTKRHARTVVAQPNPYGPPVGRPLTQAIHVDNADEAFANWMNSVRIDSARPASQYHEQREALIRKVQTDSMVDYLALPSRPTTQANKETEATISFEGPAPPLRHVKMLERPLEEWKMWQEKGMLHDGPNTRGAPPSRGLLKSRGAGTPHLARNLSVTFASVDGPSGSERTKEGMRQDRVKFDSKPAEISNSKTMQYDKLKFESAHSKLKMSAVLDDKEMQEELSRNAELRRYDARKEAELLQRGARKLQSRERHRSDTMDYLGGDGRVNPLLHRGLPTPLLEYKRPTNPEHYNDRDFNRHIRLMEHYNNPEKLEHLLKEQFDFSKAGESLDVRAKREAKAGRRAPARYGQ